MQTSAETIDASYVMQMAAYRAILARTWPHRLIRAAILYTDGPALFELPDTLLKDSLERLAGGL